MISIRGTLSADDLITDFMCEPADMDDWMSTATTPHAGQGQGSHDPHLSVGSSAGTGFFSRRSSSPQQPAGGSLNHAVLLFIERAWFGILITCWVGAGQPCAAPDKGQQ